MHGTKKRHARRQRGQLRRGMTLVEIMIVVAIIGLIMGGVSVVAFNQLKKARVSKAQDDVREILHQTELFKTQREDACPADIAEMVKENYLRKVPKDPWGQEYVFKCPGEHGIDSADVISKGPNKQVDACQQAGQTANDDICSWELP